LITDRISNNKDNYNRHFTTTSRLKFKLKHFGVRTSGAIAMLDGENQSFEFRTDAIKEIARIDNKIEIIVQITGNVFRNLEIEVRSIENDVNVLDS